MTLADSISRQPCSNAESLEFDVQISYVQFSTQKLDELRRETRNDNELLILLKVIADGWPERRRDLHPQLRAYWPFRDELVADDGIVLKGNQIVMPTSLHAETLGSYTNPTRASRRHVYVLAHVCSGMESIRSLRMLCASVQRANKCSVPNNVSPSCHTRPLHVLGR